MNDLLKRSVTGLIFVLVLVAGILVHPFVFGLVFLTFMIFTQIEFYRLFNLGDYKSSSLPGNVFGGLLFVICFAVANQFIPWQFCLLFLPILVLHFIVVFINRKESSLKSVSIITFGFIYIAVPFSLLNFIVFPGFPTQSVYAPFILLGVFFIIWIYDTMAYVFGSLIGKHKIASNISPNKSWEGLVGGSVFAVIMAILNAVIFQSESMTTWIVLAIIIIIFGTLGDFFESKIKRDLGVKDSGSFLPGHGGLLDRFDSFLFAIPFVYFWLVIGGTF